MIEPTGKRARRPTRDAEAPQLGRFQPERFLGEGSFGAVWKVRDPLRPGTDLAIKVLQPLSRAGGQEFRMGAVVRHPALLDTLEAGLLEGSEPSDARPYLLMEFFDGEPLRPPREPTSLVEIAEVLLSALNAIHSAGWRHGDIKSENVLVGAPAAGATPEVRLLDFGLAEEIEAGENRRTGGTPRYLAPEVLRGGRPDHRADLYALGVLLYECLEGVPTRSVSDHLLRTRQGVFFQEVQTAALPEPLGRLIRGLLEPDPRDRLSSAAEGVGILAGRDAREGTAPTPAATVPVFEAARPIGRESWLAAFRDALAAATGRSARPTLLCLEGAAGLGKTRLLTESSADAYARGVRSISWPLLKYRLEQDERLTVARRQEGAWDFPEFERPEESARNQLDREATLLFEKLLEQPSLLVVDDFEKLPSRDAHLLSSLAEKLRGFRLPARSGKALACPVVLVMARGAETASTASAAIWERIVASPLASHQLLAAWSDDDARRYLDRVLGTKRQLGEFEEVLLGESRGNPARLRLALRELARTGELFLRDGVWVSERSPDRGPVPVPGELEELRQEWRSLAAAARNLLGIGAVLSERDSGVRLQLLARAAGMSPAAVEDLFRGLKGTEFFGRFAIEGSRGSEIVLGFHRAFRAWILRLAGPVDRSGWRGRIAALPECCAETVYQRVRAGSSRPSEILEVTRGGGPLAERILAYHALASAEPLEERSVSALGLAEILLRRGELRRAEGYLEIARRGAPDPMDRARAEIFLGEAAARRGDPDGALAHFEAAARIRLPAGGLDARRLFDTAAATFQKGDIEEASRVVDEALEKYPTKPELHSLSGNIARSRGDFRGAESAYIAGLELAGKSAGEVNTGTLRTNYGYLLVRMGQLSRAAEMHQAAAREYERAGARSGAALATANLGVAYRRLGEFDRAVDAANRSLSIRRELGDLEGVANAEVNLGLLARELGLPGTASRCFSAAMGGEATVGSLAAKPLLDHPLIHESRALVALDVGDLETARELEKRSRGGRTQTGALSPEGLLLRARLVESGAKTDIGEIEEQLAAGVPDAQYAPALAELALWSSEKKRSRTIQNRAAELLAELAGESDRAAFYHQLVTLARAGEKEDTREVCEALLKGLEDFPERAAKRRALVLLARRAGNEEARTRTRGLLRKLLDEITFDLDAGDREGFRSRTEIKEALMLARDVEREERGEDRAARILKEIFQLNRQLLEEEDLDRLLRKIVDAAVRLTDAERGALVLRRQGRLALAAARSGGKDLPDPENQISWTIVERTAGDATACIATDASEETTLRSIASVEELGLRSVICVPLRGKRRVLGVLYLDNSFEQGVFETGDLELIENFCGQAVLAWQTTERRRELGRALARLEENNRQLDGELRLSRREARLQSRSQKKSFNGIVGDSAPIRKIFQLIEAVAPTEIPVLITGESGTGKELVARAIYRESGRADRPFVVENCGAVPAGLLESALFGHVKGAFTGADRDRPGLFEMANGGTLFLDEIAEMPIDLQTRLLRVLQEGEVRPLGSQRVLKVNVRILAATNQDIRESLAEGKIREDLYYRLQGAEIVVPPLRQRPEDIPILVEHFLKAFAPEGQSPRQVSAEAMERMVRYPWPGNVRELENEVRRLAVLSPTEIIGAESLGPHVREGLALPMGEKMVEEDTEVRPLQEVEHRAIRRAMDLLSGHRGKVAKALGISRSTLYLKLKDMGDFN